MSLATVLALVPDRPDVQLIFLDTKSGFGQAFEKVDWKLITDLPVQSRKDAIEKLEWYALNPSSTVRAGRRELVAG